ncbi:MAG TPA: SdrD B-like domain-containing protein, partial [Ferruginibacter sp.]|nr:SdrD B-like domain-containing protein [Ferruginibacter sp.]
TVKTTVNGCTSASGSGTSAPKAAPTAPTASVTQPTCTTLTGTISVTSPKTGLSFSIDGSNYSNTSGSFSNVAPGTYNLTAKNSVGCVSTATVITITASQNCSSIGNYVFKDANANGLQDNNESGLSGVTVQLLNNSGTVLTTTTTSSSGAYTFSSLAPGTYSVKFTTSSGFYPSPSNAG